MDAPKEFPATPEGMAALEAYLDSLPAIPDEVSKHVRMLFDSGRAVSQHPQLEQVSATLETWAAAIRAQTDPSEQLRMLEQAFPDLVRKPAPHSPTK